MHDFFKKVMGDKEELNPQSYKNLIKNMEITKAEISELDACLDYVTDPILLNQIIFQRKATEMRYRYWYKLAREMKTADE